MRILIKPIVFIKNHCIAEAEVCRYLGILHWILDLPQIDPSVGIRFLHKQPRKLEAVIMQDPTVIFVTKLRSFPPSVCEWADYMDELRRNSGERQRLFILRLEETCYSLFQVCMQGDDVISTGVITVARDITIEELKEALCQAEAKARAQIEAALRKSRWDLSELRP